MKMTSKERVLAAIRHQQTDRVPFFHMGTEQIDRVLAQRLGLANYQEEELLCALKADIRFVRPSLIPHDGEHRAYFQVGSVHARLHHEKGYEKLVIEKPPLDDVEEAEAIYIVDCWPDPDWFDYKIPGTVVRMYQDKAVVARGMGGLFLYAMALRGMENILIDMAINPEIAQAIFTKIADTNLQRITRFLEANPGVIDILDIGDDVAGQTGMIFSVAMWRTFIKPRLAQLYARVHAGGKMTFQHTCGSVIDIVPDLIEIGLDVLQSLQPEAMDVYRVKQLAGKKLRLWGGLGTQKLLPFGTPAEIRSEVRRLRDELGKNGGYVFTSSKPIMKDVPLANAVALIEETLAG